MTKRNNSREWKKYYAIWRAKNKNYHRDKMRSYRGGYEVVTILGVAVHFSKTHKRRKKCQ